MELANGYGIWLSFNNQEEGLQLPVLPGELAVNGQGNGSEYDVSGLGKINVIKAPGLSELSVESIFPAQRCPFVSAPVLLEPSMYVDYIQRWRVTKHPIRLVFVGATMELNMACSIEGFEWKEVAGAVGDISYTLKLKEYRFYAARKVTLSQSPGANGTAIQIAQKQAAKRSSDKQQATSHTLTAGESLWSVAKKELQDGSRWHEIQKLNGLTDAQVKNLPVGLALKLPKSGGSIHA